MTKTYTYNNAEEYEFMECADCAAKPGSPILCPACYHNRTVIDRLNRLIATTRRETVEGSRKILRERLKELHEANADFDYTNGFREALDIFDLVLDQLPDKQEV